MKPSLARTPFSRRMTSRVDVPEGVSVYWHCNGHDDVSHVLDLSTGGLFIQTQKPKPVGARARIEFLVQEGQIRADALVRYVQPNRGLGLKFTSMPESDRPRLGMLITRLRHLSRFQTTGEVIGRLGCIRDYLELRRPVITICQK